MSEENSCMMRTLSELAEYDFVIRYRPGNDNLGADAMSRIMSSACVTEQCEEGSLPKGLHMLEVV
jgi:hypothetical protein